MLNKTLILLFSIISLFFFHFLSHPLHVEALNEGLLVEKDQRRSLIVTEHGEISAIEISDGIRGPHHLQIITLEPNSLFLPVLLHADTVLYAHTGSGRLSWADEDDTRRVNIRRGDILRLQPGSVFYIQSNLEPEREKLRIYAIFAHTDEDLYEPSIGAYSSISDLVRGFDKKVLQAAFMVPEDVIEEITNATKPPAIVHAVPQTKRTFWELEARFLKAFFGRKGNTLYDINGKKKKTRTFNILDAEPDFKNCNGWSLTVTRKNLHSLKGSNIGVFMVNLTEGSMMGPHWNPMATEIAIVLYGQGMVRVVCSSTASESECKNMRFRVKEGDVFAVPRFHSMAQMSFNNDSFVFMGFSTTTKINHPQFLAGKNSVLQTLDKEILALSFNVSNTTIDQLLAPQADSFILQCTSCAEEEEAIMEEEIEKRKQEEEAREREEERKREEEEARRREEEEEEERQREEAARKREEDKRRQEEEKEKREEKAEREQEEARRQEEERQKREKQEEKEKEKEEEAEREREEARRQEEEREKKEKQHQEEERRQQEEEEEERKQREEEEREQEEARRREEEREKRDKQHQEEERRHQEEEQEEARRQEEEREKKEREQREEEKWQQEETGSEEERQIMVKQQKEEEKRRQGAAEREHEEARIQEEQREKRERREAGKTQAEARREEQVKEPGSGEERGVLNIMWGI